MRRLRAWLVPLVLLAVVSCTAQDNAHNAAINKAESRSSYVQQNDVEFINYDRRQRISDDPSTIIWCTSAFPVTGSPLITVPVVGKLTSGDKRPFASDPGPDGMYGSSGEYRYGFTPSGVYEDFYNMATYCTTEPSVFQTQSTRIVMATDERLLAAQQQAQALLKAGKPQEAQKILEAAIGGK